MIQRTQEEICKFWDVNKPLVTIQCTVYNQERYVNDCIDGFLMQETDFPFEIVIHDDASTDGTVEILKEYQQNYPKIINVIYEHENQYSKHNGEIQRILNNYAKGKYLAFCEGDDYWCSKNKLQKQYDFMEQHTEYSAVGHLTKTINNKGEEISTFIDSSPGEYTKQEHENWQLFAHWSSIFCRNYTRIVSNQEMLEYSQVRCPGDRKKILLLMKIGKLFVLPNVYSVYRYQSGDSSYTSGAFYNKVSNVWKEGFYLSQYAFSLGFNFKYKKRQKKTMAIALAQYIIGIDKDSYLEIKELRKSFLILDIFDCIPTFVSMAIDKIKK